MTNWNRYTCIYNVYPLQILPPPLLFHKFTTVTENERLDYWYYIMYKWVRRYIYINIFCKLIAAPHYQLIRCIFHTKETWIFLVNRVQHDVQRRKFNDFYVCLAIWALGWGLCFVLHWRQYHRFLFLVNRFFANKSKFFSCWVTILKRGKEFGHWNTTESNKDPQGNI